MAKNLIISILTALLVSTVAGRAAGGLKKTKPLMDGFVLAGVDGKLRSADGNDPDKWFFEFDSDVSDGKGLVKAGATIELVPSAAMEKMTQYAIRNTQYDIRLWGKVTKYGGRNFIFGIYFLPLSKVKRAESSTSQKTQQKDNELTINESNDVLAIPQEIIDKLKARPTVRTAQLRKGLALKQDFILADRTGFISSCVARDAYCEKGKAQNTQYDFVLDALGRNVPQVKLNLLPCEVLEKAEQRQSAEPEPIRFKVAGIVTKYKGENYLLLHRAERTYNHGNFGR